MTISVAVIQLGYGDQESSEQRTAWVVELVRAQRGHDLVVLPELWSAGGFDYRHWQERAQSVPGEVITALGQAARDIGAVVHAGSVVERSVAAGPEGRDLWNTSVVLDRHGEILTSYRKIHRFGFGNGEPKLMEAGHEIVTFPLWPIADDGDSGATAPGAVAPQVAPVEDLELAHEALPVPEPGLRAALSTCYDLRFPELYRRQLDAGAELFCIPAAWPAARVEHWRLLLRARAIENQCFVIGCNTAGTHAGTEMGGRSAVIDPGGTVLAEAGTEQEVLSVQIDPAEVAAARERFPVLADRRL